MGVAGLPKRRGRRGLLGNKTPEAIPRPEFLRRMTFESEGEFILANYLELCLMWVIVLLCERMLMSSLRSNLVKRIARLPKPARTSDALQPLFEAISNSIHSTQAKFGENVATQGSVVISVTTGRKQAPVSITVEDNGLGLDEANYDAFMTTDTDNKIAIGGKGVG